MATNNYDDIRPCNDSEIEEVLGKLLEVPYFVKSLGKLFPTVPTDVMLARLHAVKTQADFQFNYVIPFLRTLVKNTSDALTTSGLDNLSLNGEYIFMSNHRDIILDSAILNAILTEVGFPTTEIAIGSNLLIYDWITDLVKLNKSFIVKRDLPVRQMMEASSHLSAYIRDSITRRHQNLWIAQREGRSKDGNDHTQGSVLKMLNLSGAKSLAENFAELNIVPVAISYEYDPCDAQKAYQYQLKRDMPDFKKSQDDDLKHMSLGLFGRKGHIHFAFGKPINSELSQLEGLNKNEQINAVAGMIDRQIYLNYHLNPNNYMALDKINGNNEFADHYTEKLVDDFDAYIYRQIGKLGECDAAYVRQQMLQAYANPLINKIKAQNTK